MGSSAASASLCNCACMAVRWRPAGQLCSPRDRSGAKDAGWGLPAASEKRTACCGSTAGSRRDHHAVDGEEEDPGYGGESRGDQHRQEKHRLPEYFEHVACACGSSVNDHLDDRCRHRRRSGRKTRIACACRRTRRRVQCVAHRHAVGETLAQDLIASSIWPACVSVQPVAARCRPCAARSRLRARRHQRFVLHGARSSSAGCSPARWRTRRRRRPCSAGLRSQRQPHGGDGGHEDPALRQRAARK